MRSVAHRIAQSYQQGNQMIVVVSAMGDTTDDLMDLAYQVSKNPSAREMDMLLTAGERISMALLSMALADEKVPALSLTGSQSGIITDQSHRRARIRRILGDRVRATLEKNAVAIVGGFQGVSETKEITTLGRGGSDTSAVALAAALGADACEIYSDVDGVYSADPRIVSNAKFLKTIPHDLMVEMATRGAGVLHPRSVELAKQYGVPLKVKNSQNQNEGTSVIATTAQERLKRMEEFSVTGVTADRDKLFLSITLSRSTLLGALWERAAQAHLSIVSPTFFSGEVRFFSDRDGEMEWRKHLEDLVSNGFLQSYTIDPDIVPLSVIGDRFSQDGMALQQVVEALARENILVTLGTASALAITVGISIDRAEEGVKILHAEFLEEKME